VASGLNVTVGRLVELTQAERYAIGEYTAVMNSLARRQTKGWFLPYVQAHTAVARIIREAVARSHAN